MSFLFLPASADKHICVIGDIMLDHYVMGICDRISPEAPVPVVDVISEKYTLGGAGNVLENIKAFGCKASLISVCGDDKISDKLNDELALVGPVFHHIVKDNSRKTTIKTRVLASKHQLIRLDSESKHDISSDIATRVITCLTENIAKINAVIISDYLKGVLTNTLIKEIINICKQNNVITIIDSKKKDLSVFHRADLIKPNRKEAALATGINIVDDASLKKACEKIAEITQCKYLVVTLSEDGLAIYHKGILTKMPTRSLDVFDVTGAGDTVVSALAFGLVNGLTIKDACDLANHAAAIVVGKVGSATATIQEINQKFFL